MSVRVLVLERDDPSDLEYYVRSFRRELPEVSLVAAANEAEAIAVADGANILMAKADGVTAKIIAAMPQLQWIQALTTGTDYLTPLNLSPSVTITSARGIHGPQMSELALLLMMALARDVPRLLRNQNTKAWQRWPQPLLIGKTTVLVGVGAISEELAVRCKALGMRVVGISDGRSEVNGFDVIYPRSALVRAAAEADFLVALVPYRDETHHLISHQVLNAMPRHGRFINLARGKVVDEGALIEALRQGRIAGAGLDVFATEPLPADSPLWNMPNVIVTPHIGGMSDTYCRQLLPLMVENLRTFMGGRVGSMRNIVHLGVAETS